jgi:hypothetical protein
MAQVNRYQVHIYGDEKGFSGRRAEIALLRDAIDVGSIRFYDSGTPIPQTRLDEHGLILMHLPVALLPVVIDVLRNEAPLTIEGPPSMPFGALGTLTAEPVGEGE